MDMLQTGQALFDVLAMRKPQHRMKSTRWSRHSEERNTTSNASGSNSSLA